MQTYLWRLMRRCGVLGIFLAGLFALGGCGGGDNPVANSGASTGDVIVGLTDAEGDFLTYAVDVKQLTLTKANGEVVNVLPQSTRVDFAQYTELTEFFTAATVPAGQYTKATLTLDYSSADIQVEVGGTAQAAMVKDSNGNAITGITEVQVMLENVNPLVVAPGIPAHLTLDFDLESSHSVNATTTPVEVTLNPMLTADVTLEDPKPHRMRGLLAGVDQGAARIDLNIRPFYTSSGAFGQLAAYVNDQTVYEIDGLSYTGSAGLVALAGETLDSWVVVYGAINTVTKRFEASEVYGGSSVPGSQYDMVTGVVMARNGNILTVNAGSIVKPDGTLIFNKDVTVDVSILPKVTRQLAKDTTFTKDDISVGQRLMLLGTLSTGNDTLAAPVLARMLISQISGTVLASSSNTLTLTLQYLNGRPADRYTFAGIGAIAASYEVDITGLTLSVEVGDAVRVRGFVTPFGTSSPNFTAQTVIGLANLPATLGSTWLPASANAVTVPSTNRFDLNLTGSVLHKVWQGGIVIDALDGAANPAILANSPDKGLFAINDGGAVYVYHSFSAFASSLQTRLAGGDRVRRVVARGSYDIATHTLTAHAASVILP